jgi:hypothetical protein
LLGLADQAKNYLLENVTTENLMGGANEKAKRPDSRFPAFWGPNFDWLPDQNHGGNLLNQTHLMLMQCEPMELGGAIRLLPAWPKDWDVTFRLFAPGTTVVECEYRAGVIEKLKVTPETRRKNLILP